MSNIKKILTLEQLVQFCENTKFYSFSSKESGYQLAVQLPSCFEVEEEDNDSSLYYVKARCFHIGLNRNKSSVTESAAIKAMKDMAYKPLLANFADFTDENGNTYKDFTSHDMEVNDDGTVKYIEKQIGCITADKPYFEEDKELGKKYICARIAIPREYTDAVSIIERKGGTKVSVELCVNELEYDAKNKELLLTDIEVSGLTCLGKNPETGEEIGEGMLGSKISLEDFSTKNNSMFTQVDNTKLIETLEKLNSKLDNLSNFNINEQNAQEKSEEGGNETVTKFEELLEKYSKTEADVAFEVEGLTDEELEAKFAEIFGEDNVEESSKEDTTATEDETSTEEDTTVTETASEDDGETEDETTEEVEENETEEEVKETEVTETEACGGSGSGKKKKKYSVELEDGTTKEFEISLDEKIYALQDIVNATYSEADNTYYGVKAYESYVIMMDYWNGTYFKQSYDVDGDNYSLTGDRIEVYATYVTADEQKSLEDMRANYSSISEKLAQYEAKECEEKKNTILNSKDYSSISETEDFKALVDNHADFSVEEVQSKCDAMLLAYVKAGNSVNFASTETIEKKTFGKKTLPIVEKKKSRYGSLFSKK